jgi:hypothetical protein
MNHTKKALTILFLSSLFMATPFVQPSFGQSSYNPFETIEQRRQRHNAERYQTYENNGRSAPLGGYSDRLGDPAPAGTVRPGYSSPYGANQSPPSSCNWCGNRDPYGR